jgi:hypothetical protein
MHMSNELRQGFLDAVESYVFRRGSRIAMLETARTLDGCSDIIPSSDRDLLHELIGGETPPYTFDEAARGLRASLSG